MSKTVTLTIGERLAALKILDGFEGGKIALAGALEDIKKIAITPPEWEAAGRTITKNDQGESWKWNEEDAATHKTIDLAPDTAAFILNQVKAKSDAGKLTLADSSVLSLETKLSNE